MEPSAAPTLTLLADEVVRRMPDSAMGRRIIELNTELLRFQAIAASAGSFTVRHAVALGQLFEEMFRRYEGEFGEWLRCAVGEDLEGRPRLSEDTARRYRTLWKKRDSLFPPDGSEPECKSLTEAYIKVGLIPAPVKSAESPSSVGQPLFKLMYVSQADAMATWPKSELQALLDRTEPIVRDRERARSILEAA